jgi:hypothetical protein
VKILLACSALAAGAYSWPAGSTNLLILGSGTTTTAIAGGNGTDVRTLGPTGDYQALYEIAWAEDSDIPCWFQVRSRHLNTASVQTNEANLGGASCTASGASMLTVADQQANHYISGISVCRYNQRIKGIEVFFSQVDAYGQVTPVSGWGASAAAIQANCANWGTWSPARHCPGGQIATQLKTYHKSDTPALSNQIKESATGIALVCRQVEQKR